MAGSRTRVGCLEGNHANRYTTNACPTLSSYIESFLVDIASNNLFFPYDGGIRDDNVKVYFDNINNYVLPVTLYYETTWITD